MSLALNPSSVSRFSRRFFELLDLCASPTLVAYLTIEDRIALVEDILLGHPLIRGGSRPRDYPLSSAREASLAIARLLRTDVAGIDPSCATYRLYDFVAAHRVLRLTRYARPDPALHGEAPAALRMLCRLLTHVIWALDRASSTYAGTPSREASDVRRACLRALGINQTERAVSGFADERSPSIESDELCVDAELLARVGARAADLSADRDEGASFRALPPMSKWLAVANDADEPLMQALLQQRDRLGGTPLRLVTIKAKHVQAFLRRARASSIQRGASTWASQTIARLRDHFASPAWGGRPCSLLVDSDAIVVLAADEQVTLEAVHGAAERFLSEWANAGRGLNQDYPRLEPALLAAARCGHAVRSIHPDVSVEVLATSLADFAVDCTSKETAVPPDFVARTRLIVARAGPERALSSAEACAGVRGEPAFDAPRTAGEPDLRVPPWYRRAGPAGFRAYGLAAWGYGLAGAAWRMATTRGLLRRLRQASAVGRIAASVGGEFGSLPYRVPRLREWGSATDMLVRIDGADVGLAFLQTPRLRGPSLSPAVEEDLGQSWLGALCDFLNDRDGPLPRSKMDDVPLLPVQLVYFGGDDLQFQVATSVWDDFWHALMRQRQETPAQELRSLAFKVSAVEVPEFDGDHELGYLFASACMNSLQALAKRALLDRGSNAAGAERVPARETVARAAGDVDYPENLLASAYDVFRTVRVEGSGVGGV